MKILVISDTHGYEENLEKVLKKTGMPDMVLHLGDSEGGEDIMKEMLKCPLYLVAGNCDFFCDYPKSRIVDADGISIFMTHGHYYHVSVGLRALAETARNNDCRVAVFGHTHKPMLEQMEDGLVILNPGSLSFPRQEGRRPGYAILDVLGDDSVKGELYYL